MLRSTILRGLAALGTIATIAAAAAVAAPPVSLEVVRAPAGQKLYATVPRPGGPERVLLRETAAAITPLKAGADPAGRALFATWTEGSSPERWFAASRDGGAHFSAARPIDTLLYLRDGWTAPGGVVPAPPDGFALPAAGRLFLVQFRTASLPEWRAALQAEGAEVLAYFPENAHLVRVDPRAVKGVAALDFVERVEPYHPWYRLALPLREWLDDPSAPATLAVRALAHEWGPAAKRRIAADARALGATVTGEWPSGHVLELVVTRAQLRALAAHDDVQSLDLKSAPENDMDLVRQDSGADWLEGQTGYCGQGVRGEVLDAGFEDTHQDFDGAMFHGAHNVDSHGTSTFGIVFGNGARDGDGSAKATGHLPCPAAQGIMADYDSLTDRFAHTQQLKNSPYFASFQTNSWGSSLTTAYDSYSQEMDDIIWRLDIAITQSQSNNGNQQSRPQAWAKNIISVGGINHSDTLSTADDCWCSGASIGPAEDGSIKPDVSYWYDSIYTTSTGNGYTSSFGGTSAATPETAGVVGLLVQMWSDNVWGTDPVGNTVFERQPHASTIKALLINCANQYPFSGTSSDLTRTHQGWGRASARNLKERAARSFVIDQKVPLKVSEKGSYDIDVLSGETELKVTMIYPDLPGMTSAALHRINDLDLTVTSPSGTVYRGNVGLGAANYSTPGGARDTKNTVENVFVQNPEPGLWKVDVEAMAVNQDEYLATPEADVVFSLVVTGGTGSICAQPAADFAITPNPARVGSAVAFTSAVSGGAGGPYTYEWDFELDGAIDESAANPAHVYRKPYAGNVMMRVKDSAGCAATVKKAITVTGPDLAYADYVGLTEVQGNANGAIDPGEVWDFTVRLANSGNEAAQGVTAALVVAPAAAGHLSVLQGLTTFGDIAVGATGTAQQSFRVQIGQQYPCGQDGLFSLVAIHSADPVNTYPDAIAAVHLLVGGAGPSLQFYADGLETDRGWTFGGSGEWQIAAPSGKGGGGVIPGQPPPNPDPTAAFEGTKVLGNDLTGVGPNKGNYEALIDSAATSYAIDCSGAVHVQLQFERYLNVLMNDTAAFAVSNDGAHWTQLFSTAAGLSEANWGLRTYDVSAIADRAPAFQIRFRIQSDNVAQTSGWNIDDIRLFGVTKDSCQPVTRAKPGTASGLTVTRGLDGLHLAWGADCGGTGSYGIYRGDLALGYASLAAEPGACGVSGTAATVPAGAGTADFFLVVPNDGGFEGSYGKTSLGVERAPAASACHPRDLVDACTP